MKLTGQRNILVFFICLIQLLLIPAKSSGSTQGISDVINIYGKVTVVNIDNVVLDDVTGFAVGDTTLLIQMKGGVIDTNIVASTQFGYPVAYADSTGQYEFIIIENINGGTKTVTFRNNILGGYDPESFVQLVKVRSYIDVSVDGTLTCEPWDSIAGTGGVLALISKRRVVLNADIDVSGKGFMGGDSSVIAGLCISADPDRLNKLYFHRDSALAGFKGEGLASHIEIVPSVKEKLFTELYARGKKYIYTGGGGGNGRFSGGGGGASYNNGGTGAKDECNSFVAGVGGYKLYEIPLSYKPVIMGGGGGSSGYITGGTGSSGGNGGGIVFILTDTIIGNGHSIIADGESVETVASGEGGAGGGGAAGAIVISANQYGSSSLTLSVNGGNGGSTENIFGSGGGGSGGLVYASTNLSLEPTVSTSFSGGTRGRINYPPGTPLGSDGTGGEDLFDLKMLLNGFLFNSIVSSVTSTLTDSVCFGEIPPVIKGTNPVGGTAPYTYRWETSDDNISWILYPGSGSTKDLAPDIPETDTVWFRRVVTDVSMPTPISDTSKAVIIMVQPLITGNLIGYDTIICAGQDPVPLVAANSGPGGGNSLFTYQWIDSTSVTDWLPSMGDNTGDAYDPAALTSSVYYKRVTTSGRCVDTTGYVTISVLPLLADNTISADQLICEDHLFTDLAGSDPTGADGAGTYLYEWISSTDGSSWAIAEGTIDGKNYDPDEGSTDFPGDQYFMRIVRSGHLDCCVDTSAHVLLTMLSLISNNVISADQDICEGDVPAPFTGGDPGGGESGTYTYIWEDSTRLSTWSLIAGADLRDYAPGALADTTWYRRVILSSACDDTSNVIVVNVHPSIINNSITTLAGAVDTIICSTAVPNQFLGSLPGGGLGAGTYLYEWIVSTNMTTWVIVGGDVVDYSPGSLTETSYFKRVVNSGECSTESNIITVTVLPLLGNNIISPAQTVCYNTIPSQLTGSLPTGGDNTYTYLWEESNDNITWTTATEVNNLQSYQPGNLTVPVYYRRTVTSGLSDCCQDTSTELLIGIYPLPTGVITVAKDTSCAGEEISVALSLTGANPWDIVLNDGTNDHSFQATSLNYDYKDSPVTPVDYIYQFVSITDANGCVATSMTGSHEHKVFEIPVSDAGPDDETCGLDYTLTAIPSVGSGFWISNEATLTAAADMSNSSNDITVDTYGSYTFWWKETNWQCTDSASVDITFWEPPSPADAGSDTLLMPYTYEYLLEGTDPVVGVGTWYVIQSDGSPLFSDSNSATALVTVLGDGENILKWIVENGVCPVEEDLLSINVGTIIIHSGFSPNGDGLNDYFVINGIGNTENELVITDMSGLIVYNITNYKNEWDGLDMYGNYLPDGTYYYFLKVLSEPKTNFKGFVIIKRNF